MRHTKLVPKAGLIIASALMAAGITAAVTFSQIRAQAAAETKTEIGHAAPGFSLPNVTTGKTVTLDSLRQGKKATVVMFIATRCPVSNAYNERMVALATKYSSQGIAFAGINSNHTEPTSECAGHAKENAFAFPVLKDAGNVVADSYAANVTPETYVIDANGVLVYHGRIDNSRELSDVKTHELADALDNILAGKPVEKARARAFGCSIKRG